MGTNPWEFGWQAVGTIFTILSFLLVLIIEVRRIANSPNSKPGYSLAYIFGATLHLLVLLLVPVLSGWLISKPNVILRLVGMLILLLLGFSNGVLIGVAGKSGPFIPVRITLVGLGLIISVLLWPI